MCVSYGKELQINWVVFTQTYFPFPASHDYVSFEGWDFLCFVYFLPLRISNIVSLSNYKLSKSIIYNKY